MIKPSSSFRIRAVQAQAGFSLVEVSLALLVVAIGLVTLMSLFPAGLKEVESAVQNTRTAMFADDKFNSYQAKALLAQTVAEFGTQIRIFGNSEKTGDKEAEPYLSGSAGNLVQWKYFVQLYEAVPSTPVWRVRLEVKAGKLGGFVDPEVYYTELVFSAPPP